jgi:hypothetical protein
VPYGQGRAPTEPGELNSLTQGHSGLSRASKSDCIHNCFRSSRLKSSVRTDAKGIIDSGERKPQGHKGCHSEDLGVTESNRAGDPNVLSRGVVGIARHLACP